MTFSFHVVLLTVIRDNLSMCSLLYNFVYTVHVVALLVLYLKSFLNCLNFFSLSSKRGLFGAARIKLFSKIQIYSLKKISVTFPKLYFFQISEHYVLRRKAMLHHIESSSSLLHFFIQQWKFCFTKKNCKLQFSFM